METTMSHFGQWGFFLLWTLLGSIFMRIPAKSIGCSGAFRSAVPAISIIELKRASETTLVETS